MTCQVRAGREGMWSCGEGDQSVFRSTHNRKLQPCLALIGEMVISNLKGLLFTSPML